MCVCVCVCVCVWQDRKRACYIDELCDYRQQSNRIGVTVHAYVHVCRQKERDSKKRNKPVRKLKENKQSSKRG